MRILVAGGTGFVGSHVVTAALRAGYAVRSLSRRPPASGSFEDVEYVVGDLANAGDADASLAGVDAGVYAITTTTPGSAALDPTFDLMTNLVACVRFVQAADRAGVGKLVLLSSGGTVYGVPRELPIPESHPTDPIGVYGATRLALEKVFALARAETTIFRIGNAFGERQDPGRGQGAGAAFLRALLNGAPVEFWGDGSVVRDYVYAGDIAEACMLAVGHGGAAHRVLNVGSGRGTSLVELLDVCAALVGREPEFIRKAGRGFDVPSVVLDVRAVARELGWTATTSLQEGLERELDWLARDAHAGHAAFDT
jgi:UDP-glucose 4-epimerase